MGPRAAAAALLRGRAAGAAWLRFDASLAYLPGGGEARWIVLERPASLGGYAAEESAVHFRRRFVLSAAAGAEIEASALRAAEYRLDGRPLTLPAVLPLGAGEHELVAIARNADGPPALRLYSKGFGLATGPDWEASADGKRWSKAAAAGARPVPEFSLAFGPAGDALRRGAALLLVFFALLLVRARLGVAVMTAASARWLLLAAWGALALNDLFKLPLGAGYDARAHFDFIVHVLKTGSLPRPDQSWEAFQAPLYYLAQAPALWLTGSLRALRVLGLVCGALQLELAFRVARRLYPEREDLQILGAALGGFVPVNLYMSQFIGNEPLAAALSAAAIVFAWSRNKPAFPRDPVLLGSVIGLAVLAKVSAALLVLPLAVFLFVRSASSKRAVAAYLASAAAVCGWWFLRNWLSFGAPVVSGWDPARGFAFWQEPGYLVAADFLRFGRALLHPVYAATAGFWDSLYSTFWADGFWGGSFLHELSPRWNYPFVVWGVWLALLPSCAVLLGIRRAFAVRDARRPILLFSAAAVAVYLGALFVVFVRHPFYSTAKASYMLGLLPCFVALALAGFEGLTARPRARAVVHAWMGCWTLSAFAAYFVR